MRMISWQIRVSSSFEVFLPKSNSPQAVAVRFIPFRLHPTSARAKTGSALRSAFDKGIRRFPADAQLATPAGTDVPRPEAAAMARRIPGTVGLHGSTLDSIPADRDFEKSHRAGNAATAAKEKRPKEAVPRPERSTAIFARVNLRARPFAFRAGHLHTQLDYSLHLGGRFRNIEACARPFFRLNPRVSASTSR